MYLESLLSWMKEQNPDDSLRDVQPRTYLAFSRVLRGQCCPALSVLVNAFVEAVRPGQSNAPLNDECLGSVHLASLYEISFGSLYQLYLSVRSSAGPTPSGF